VLAKHRRGAFLKQSKYHTNKALELVHGDLCGPVKPTTPSGWRYFLLLVDDATCYMWVTASGGQVGGGRRHQAHTGDDRGVWSQAQGAENRQRWEIHGGRVHRILRRRGSHATLLGVVERRNQTVVAMARALLKQRGMPAEFWREAVVTVVYLQNRLPTKSLAGRTPYEDWHGRKPAMSDLRVFGCRAFVKQLGHVNKLADRNCAGVLIGYTEGAKAYRILDPVARQVCSVRDVLFDEAHDWD
jgi:hypothetical protein